MKPLFKKAKVNPDLKAAQARLDAAVVRGECLEVLADLRQHRDNLLCRDGQCHHEEHES